jgi:uncharacterized protein
MILPDANLLLYAYDQTNVFHDAARLWWEERIAGTETIGLCPCVVFAFVRIGTNPKAFEHPLHMDEAVSIVDQWKAAASVQLLTFTPEDVECAMQLLQRAGAGGNLTTDAQIAACALRLKAGIETADTDFARFGVPWRNPLAAS